MKKNNRFWIYTLTIMSLFAVLFTACEDDNNEDDDQNPIERTIVLVTSEVTDIAQATATCGGIIAFNSGVYVKKQGVCWSTNQDPTIEDSITTDELNNGSFISEIADLAPETTYYVRAYATVSAKTGYGCTKIFTTQMPFNK